MFSAIVIDGYNLLHVLGFVRGKVSAKGLEAARFRLLDFLAPLLGAAAARTTVIFDASGNIDKLRPHDIHEGIGVRYSGAGKEADDVIEEEIARFQQPDKLAVVSSDRRLKDAARRGGAKSFGCSEFLDWLEMAQRPSPPRDESESGGEDKPPGSAEKKHWLQEFAGLADDPELKEAFDELGFADKEPQDE